MSVIGWQLFAADLLREWLHQVLLWEMVDHGVLDLVDWMAVVRPHLQRDSARAEESSPANLSRSRRFGGGERSIFNPGGSPVNGFQRI